MGLGPEEFRRIHETVQVFAKLTLEPTSRDRRGGMSDTESQKASLELVSKIVTAYVSNSSVSTDQLPGLIRSVHDALSGIGDRPVQSR